MHRVVAVATGDKRESVERFRRETRASYPIVLDPGDAAARFEITSSPTCVVVQPDGTISYRGSEPPGDLR